MPNDILTPIGNLRGALSTGGIVYPQIIGSASGEPAHFTDGTFNYFLKLIFNIDTKRSGSGTPSPNNPLPFIPITDAAITISPTFNPLDGTVYNVSWNNGIFGGYADTVSKKLTVTRKRVKAKDLTWTYFSGSGGYFSSPSLNDKELGSFNIEAEIFITSESTTITYMEDNSIKGADNNKRIYVRCNDAAGDLDAFKAILGESYIVYDIDPDEVITGINAPDITSIDGTNYIWANSGEIFQANYIVNTNQFLQWLYDNVYNP